MLAEQNFNANMTNGSEVIEKILFSWHDYTLFAFMLGISTAIGIYFGFFGKKQNSVKEYIFGGKTMKTFPIAMSLIASDISGNAFVAVPGDIYVHGASFWITLIALGISGFISYYVYLPVFYKLQLTSCFEYLKLRFDERNCMFGSFLISFTMFLFLPIVIYIPALTFSQVTDIDIHYVTPVVCIVCVFYTTLGGLKAVVWTDTIQFSVMTMAMILVMILGFVSLGGIGYVFKKSYEGGRLFLWDFDFDPTNRTAFWSPITGMTFSWTAYVVASQVCNQKLQALPSYRNVKWAMMIFVIGVIIVRSISVITGLIIYAKYADCDPITINRVGNSDQLVPLYIMEVAGKVPGLPGLFIAGIFCAALSTMSTYLNTLSGLIYEDFLKPFLPENTTEKRASDIMKLMVVIMGFYATGMVHVVEHLGTVFGLALSLGEMTAGPLLGMFSLGMLVPVANSKGTLTGAISALLLMGWISFGSQYHVARGGIITPALPTSIEGCDLGYDVLNSTAITGKDEYTPPWIYRISFYYYSFIGIIITMVVGLIVSIFSGGRDQKVNRDLLSPVVHFLLPKQQNENYKFVDIIMKTSEKSDDVGNTADNIGDNEGRYNTSYYFL